MSVPPSAAKDPAPEVADVSRVGTIPAGTVRRRATRGVLVITFNGVAVRAFALVGNIALARLLTPRDFGLAAIGFTIVTFGAFLGNGGLGASLLGQRERPSREDLGAVLGFQLMAGIAFACVVAAVGVPLGLAGGLAALMTLTLPFDAFRIPAAIVAERDLRYTPIVIGQVIELFAYYGWAICAAALGMGVWSIATAAVLRALVGSAALIALVPGGLVRPRLAFGRLRRMLGFGVRFQAVGGINLVRDQGLNLAIAAIAGVAALGLWSIAYRLGMAIMLLFEALWRVAFPAMARLLDAGEDAAPVLERGMRLTATATGFLVVAVGGSAPVLVPTLFGQRWSEAASVLPWAALGIMIAGSLTACAAGYLYAVGDARTALRATLVHTLVWFAVSLPLLPGLGVEALGIGWLAASVVDFAIYSAAVRRRTGISPARVLHRPIAAAGLGMAGGLIVAETVAASVPGLVASLAVGEGLYLAAIWLLDRGPLTDLVGLALRTVRAPA